MYGGFGLGGVLLGAILEKATGENYHDLVQKHITKPCQMKNTFIGKPTNNKLYFIGKVRVPSIEFK